MTEGKSGTASGGAIVYAEYIQELVHLHEGYKGSMEQRAVSVITTSSTIAALLFGFTALARGKEEISLSLGAVLLLAAAAVAFAGAAALAIRVNAPREYKGPTVDALEKLIEEAWNPGRDANYAGYQVAAARLDVLRSAKLQNEAKATALSRAIWSEFVGVAALAAAIVVILVVR